MSDFQGTKEQKAFELKRIFNCRRQCVKLGLLDSALLYEREYKILRDHNKIGQPESV